MKINDLTSDSFYLLQTDSDPADVLRLLRDGPKVSHVVVHRLEGDREDYYLFSSKEAVQRLSEAPAGVGIVDLLGLHEWSAAEVRAAGEVLSGGIPAQAVVMAGNVVTGFIESPPAATNRVVAPSIGELSRKRGVDLDRSVGGLTLGHAASIRRSAARRDGTAMEIPSSPIQPDAAVSGGEGSDEVIEGSLEASFPEQVEQFAEVSLLISLVGKSQASAVIPVALPTGSEVEVIVQPRHGFRVVGAAEARLVVADPETAIPVRFKLTGVDIGMGEIRILAFHNGACLGQIRLQPEVLPAGQASASPTFSLHELRPSQGVPADLTLLVEESKVAGKLELYMRLFAQDPSLGLPLKRFGPLSIDIDPMGYFTDFFKDIEQLPMKTVADKAEAQRVMERKGAELYDLIFPDDMKKVLWAVRERIGSFIIQSEDPWIPWEMCRMSGEDEAGLIQEGPFLCERYVIARWNPAEAFKQPLSLKEIALVVPEDSGLDFAQTEKAFILGLGSAQRNVTSIPANPADVQAALALGTYTAFHFTGHGAMKADNPDRSVMKLERGKTFRPEDVSGRVCNLKAGRPIVFLNACQLGAGAMGLTGMGGWAQRFVTSGAGAFLGAYWSVFDQSALHFAEEFYQELIKGRPIGEAVLAARKKVRDSGDPTWLAYTLFAHPLSAVSQTLSP